MDILSSLLVGDEQPVCKDMSGKILTAKRTWLRDHYYYLHRFLSKDQLMLQEQHRKKRLYCLAETTESPKRPIDFRHTMKFLERVVKIK